MNKAPRNHVVLALMKRGSSGAGAHDKTKKSGRQKSKMQLKTAIKKGSFNEPFLHII